MPAESSTRTWTILDGEYEGKRLIARLDVSFASPASRDGRGIRIGVAIPLRVPRADGLPDDEETVALGVIEDAVIDTVASRAALVAVVTTSGMREFILYAWDADWIGAFHHQLQGAVTSHEVQVIAVRDPAWDVYEQILPHQQ